MSVPRHRCMCVTMNLHGFSTYKCARLFFYLLATLQFAHGYSTVSMGRLCSKRGGSISLHAGTAVSIVLDSFNMSAPCNVHVTVPPSFHISMVFTRRHRQDARLHATDADATAGKQCPISVTYPGKTEQVARTLDLCAASSAEEMKYTEMFASHIVLGWQPTPQVLADDVLALEVILASVGRGRDTCSRPDMFPCVARPPFSVDCVGLELVCDGHRNCPYSGNDEDPVLCDSERFSRLAPGKLPLPQDSFHFGQGLQFIASEMIKKLIDSKNVPRIAEESDVSTEKTTVLWFDEENGKNRSHSLPNVLNHYGPWGYLMLGMLICGTVLMFCGLWECCCRRPKAATSSNGPTLLIINQGAQGAEGLEVPATPNPPRYEDLDQPPSYTTLFPSSKSIPSFGDPPPLESPSSSQMNVDSSSRIFTIDCPTDIRPKTITPPTRKEINEHELMILTIFLLFIIVVSFLFTYLLKRLCCSACDYYYTRQMEYMYGWRDDHERTPLITDERITNYGIISDDPPPKYEDLEQPPLYKSLFPKNMHHAIIEVHRKSSQNY